MLLSVPVCDMVSFSESTDCCMGLCCVCERELKAQLSACHSPRGGIDVRTMNFREHIQANTQEIGLSIEAILLGAVTVF